MVRRANCSHCGLIDPPTDRHGYTDRHRRADWRPSTGASNEFCAGGGFGSYLKPGDPCRHMVDNPDCYWSASQPG